MTHGDGADVSRHGGDRPALSVHEAQAALLRRARPLPVETWRLDAAAGCALADDVYATVTLPPWDNAGMDGFAVRAHDVLGATPDAPRLLRVIGSIAAGGRNAPTVMEGTAVRIMTGAPVPDGADTVIRVEDTRTPRDATEYVSIVHDRDARTATRNVRPRGEDIVEGALVARAGDTLSPALLGVLASIGCATVAVHRRPRVVIAPSGDELLSVDAIDDVRAGRGIIGSSAWALEALLRATGADVRVLPALPDEPALMRDALGLALEDDCDLLLTTGGVSMGVHDHVRDVIVALGGRLDVHRVRVRPGGPTSTGHVLGTPWIGLPGNPVSTLVMAELLARPAVRALGGHARVLPTRVPVRLAHDVAAAAPLRFFLRASLQLASDGTLAATLTGRQGSNLLTSMARADALLEIEGPREQVPAGTIVPALLLDHALLVAPRAEAAAPEVIA